MKKKIAYLIMLAAMLGLLCGCGITAQEAEYKRVEDMENGIGRWWKGDPDTDREQPEVSLSLEDKIVKEGKNALSFTVTVNHSIAGKGSGKLGPSAKWLQGWPMISLDLKPVQDWSAYDYLVFWVYVDTEIPDARITLGCGIANGNTKPKDNHWWKLRTPRAPQIEKGQWKEVSIPLEEFGKRDGVGRVCFCLSESAYQDGDKIRFIIDDMRLKKIVTPVINRCEHKKLYLASEGAGEIKVVMQGVVAGKTLRVRVMEGKKEVQKSETPVTGKVMNVPLDMKGIGMGRHEVWVEVVAGQKVLASQKSEFTKLRGPFLK